MLQKMPDWTAFSLNQAYPQERAAIEQTAQRIAQYDLNTIRAAIAAYLANDGQVLGTAAARGKVLIINKYLFDLPATAPASSSHARTFGGGWWGQPVFDDAVCLRWPWSVDDDGTWHLTGTFGGFTGPPYDALQAFDYYREQFGRRTDGAH